LLSLSLILRDIELVEERELLSLRDMVVDSDWDSLWLCVILSLEDMLPLALTLSECVSDPDCDKVSLALCVRLLL
jgi:hypothetical protein